MQVSFLLCIDLHKIKQINQLFSNSNVTFYRFPCAATAKLLVRCGADVNAMDDERNTPLHVIVCYKKATRYDHMYISIY